MIRLARSILFQSIRWVLSFTSTASSGILSFSTVKSPGFPARACWAVAPIMMIWSATL